MRTVGGILGAQLKRTHLARLLRHGEVFASWPELVGVQIASKARPTGLKDGVLTVGVESAAWANELFMMKPRLLAVMQERFGTLIRDLRFQVARAPAPGEQAACGSRSPSAWRPIGSIAMTTGEMERWIAVSHQAIQDRDLAEHWGRTLVAMARRKEAMRSAGFRQCSCGAFFQGEGVRCPICQRKVKDV